MKVLFFAAFLLVGSVYTAPASNTTESDEVVTVTADFFPSELAIYTAEHDIVSILVPLNSLNFDDDSDDDENSDSETVLFFVLADIVDGKKVDQGLYIRKKGAVTKLLDNGREAAAANDETKTAYFAAKDGLYKYNDEKNTAEKYGTITDSLIGIAKYNGSDVMYVLGENHVLYKVTEEGTKKEVVEGVVDAQKIVLDYENNLYYYTSNKDVYVLTAEGPKKFEGLPEKSSYVEILRPPFIIEDGIPVIMDSKTFIAYANGTVEDAEFKMEVFPTAYSVEATLLQYYGYNKKIVELNILVLMMSSVMSELGGFLENKSDIISEIATRSRSDLRA